MDEDLYGHDGYYYDDEIAVCGRGYSQRSGNLFERIEFRTALETAIHNLKYVTIPFFIHEKEDFDAAEEAYQILRLLEEELRSVNDCLPPRYRSRWLQRDLLKSNFL